MAINLSKTINQTMRIFKAEQPPLASRRGFCKREELPEAAKLTLGMVESERMQPWEWRKAGRDQRQARPGSSSSLSGLRAGVAPATAARRARRAAS
ncbi:hypothetical protein D3C78_759480 [compost metagenome]